MNKRKLPSILAISMSLELILSPLPAMANVTTQDLLNTMNVGAGLYNTVKGAQGQGQPMQIPPHVAHDMTQLRDQQMPIEDAFFSLNKMQSIPGLMDYIAEENKKSPGSINPLELNCQTLKTSLHNANNQVCRDRKVSPLSGDPRLQADEAWAYYNQYFQVDDLYRNYQVKSNAGDQAYGPGCMKNAFDKVLKGFFDYRLAEMTKIMSKLDKASDEFTQKSKMDLMAIKESTAILNGENSKFAAEFKDTGVFDYGKRFNNPACNSILANNDMDQRGRTGGLVSIEKELNKNFSTTPPGSNYSPEAYIKNHANVVKDIKQMADKVSAQVDLNFSNIANDNNAYGGFLENLGSSVNSESGAHVGLNRAFFADLQTKFGQSRKRLTDQVGVIRSELGNQGSPALNLLSDIDNDVSFDAELRTLENEIKGDCLNRTGVDTALSRIVDPTLSKEANQHSSKQIKKRIKEIISDIRLSPEKKLSELQAIENSGGMRYRMNLDSDYEIEVIDKATGTVSRKSVKAGQALTPGKYFADVINNCESQFQVNKLNNKLSAKEAIKQLRTLKKDYQKLAKEHSRDVKNEIVKRMIDCNGNAAVQSSTVEASCSPAKLNMGSPNFCAKAAFSCSKNMQECSGKAKKFVKELRDDRRKRSDNYNNNVEAYRRKLVGIFDDTFLKYTKEADVFRAKFGASFADPTDIKRDINDGSQFDNEFRDPADPLEIKDPAKYLAMMKGNMTKLITQVKAQQAEIVGPNSAIAKHIKQTEDNYKTVADNAINLANACLDAHNSYKKMMEDQDMQNKKMAGEMGEKNGALCSTYKRVMSPNPNGACDVYDQVAKDALLSSQRSGGSTADIMFMISEMDEKCAGYGQDIKDALDICTMSPPASFVSYYETNNSKKASLRKACDTIFDPRTDTENLCNPVRGAQVVYSKEQKEAPNGRPLDAVDTDDCDNSKWEPNGERNGQNLWAMKCYKQAEANCKSLEGEMIGLYNSAKRDGILYSSTQANSMSARCPDGNNSGPYNTKSTLEQMAESFARPDSRNVWGN